MTGQTPAPKLEKMVGKYRELQLITAENSVGTSVRIEKPEF